MHPVAMGRDDMKSEEAYNRVSLEAATECMDSGVAVCLRWRGQ